MGLTKPLQIKQPHKLLETGIKCHLLVVSSIGKEHMGKTTQNGLTIRGSAKQFTMGKEIWLQIR